MLDTQTQFLISLFLLLGCALAAGELALRLGQLALVGQLIVGIVLGPTLLGPYIGLSTVSPQLSAVQLLATFFLLFLAGLEMGPGEVYRMPLSTILLGLCIFVLPFLLTFPVVLAVYPGTGQLTALFVAVALSITALPIMAVMVKELGLVGHEMGKVLMGAALVNELTAVTVFAVLLQVYNAGSHATWLSFAMALGSTGLFLAVVFGVYFLLRYARGRRSWTAAAGSFSRTVRSREAGFALIMVLSLGAALLSQYLGLTFVIGAFYAGLLVTPESVGPKTYEGVKSVLYVIMWGLFLPLLFAITGLQTNLRLLLTGPAEVAFLALLVTAMVSKIGVGAGFTRLRGWSGPDSVALGFLVNSRGAVNIAIAVILYTDGILNPLWFTVVVSVGLVCTIVAPVGAIAAWKATPGSRAALFQRVPSLALRPVLLAPREPLPGGEEGDGSTGSGAATIPPGKG